MSARIKTEVPTRIMYAMFRKGTDTLRAVQLLTNASLSIPAQVLVRVLIEVRMDLEIFLRLCAEDPKQATRQVLNAMMLEKIKQQRQSDFRGLELDGDGATPDKLLRLEEKLVNLHGKETVKLMRRNGFSGLSVEDRARELGLSDLYNVVYRNFSRNVHGTDYMEHFILQGMADLGRGADYEELRDRITMSTAIACVWKMASLLDLVLGCELDQKLGKTWEACQAFEHWANVPIG